MTDVSTRRIPGSTTPDRVDTTLRPRLVLTEIGLAVLAGLVSLVAAVAAMRVTPSILTERWSIGGDDSILSYTLFQNATQSFSWADNHDLGFPHGLNMFFSGQVDASSAVVMGLMSLVIHSGFTMLNVFYLLTFVSAGIAGYAFFRALRIRPWLSVLFGVLFSLAPFHFIRVGYGHPFIANIWAIPLVGILMLVAAGGALDPFAHWGDASATSRGRLLRRVLPPVGLGLLVASTGAYFFVFGVIAVGGVWLLSLVRALVRKQKLRSLVAATSAIVPLGFFVVVELFLLGRGYGQRFAPYFAARHPGESELYAGKLVSLLVPWTGSHFPLLVRLTDKYNASSPVLGTTEAPGTPLVASIGLMLLAVALVVAVAAPGRGLRASWFGRIVDDERARMLGPAMVWVFLFFIVTGLGIVVAMAIGPEIRAWGRISIVLILVGLAFVAVLTQEATTRFGIRWIVVGLVIVTALLDQVVGVHAATPLQPTRDPVVASFVAASDKALPDGCGVVQLPVKSFPDSGVIGTLNDYDEALPYLYTKAGDLRWSYGSILGTKGYLTFGDATKPASFARAVASSGACAVEVDVHGYTSNVGGWKPFVEAATGSVVPSIASSDGRYLLFVVPGRG